MSTTESLSLHTSNEETGNLNGRRFPLSPSIGSSGNEGQQNGKQERILFSTDQEHQIFSWDPKYRENSTIMLADATKTAGVER
jgi:hypothetical protein